MKLCSKCKIEQSLEAFNKCSRNKDGRRAECRACQIAFEHSKRAQRNEKRTEYRKKNREYINSSRNAKYEQYKQNILAYQQKYRQENKEAIRQAKRSYKQKRLKEDPYFLLKERLRTRLYCALKGNFKAGSAVADLQCSIEDFKIYIEQKFYIHPVSNKKMTWENYGEWHLDHIRPLSSFDLTDRNQLLEACHFSNYQPLWAEHNLQKADQLEWSLKL